MSALVKYSSVAIGIQVLVSAGLVLGTHGSGFLIVIDFYYPTILLITKLGGFNGESTMMLPVFLGIPLGIVSYGILFGLAVSFLKSLKK